MEMYRNKQLHYCWINWYYLNELLKPGFVCLFEINECS